MMMMMMMMIGRRDLQLNIGSKAQLGPGTPHIHIFTFVGGK
jgi:hypothetical protein